MNCRRKKFLKLPALLLALLLLAEGPVRLPAGSLCLTAAAEDHAGEDASGQEAGEESADPAEGETETEEASALSWPLPGAEIRAESAIVMDADTHCVLWGREIHTKRYPASITKLLTALVVLEHCSLDETVVFSKTAVTGLESGAVTIGTVEGDTLSVRDCLYALLLKSANEVANALAEHVAGSTEEFCKLMNRKAEELGCLNSDFRNPSGLTDSEHVTTAYDMALIACACMDNEEFLALESEPTRKLAGTINYPGGLTVTIGHKMRNRDSEYYDPRVIAGKTGFTSASGNTLVTMAEDQGRRLVAVVLKDTTPFHYTDTQALLEFGFGSFETLAPSDSALLELYGIEERLTAAGRIPDASAVPGASNSLRFSGKRLVTVPRGAGLKNVELQLSPVLPADAPEKTVARCSLSCLGREGTSFYVLNEYTEPVPETEPEAGPSGEDPGENPEEERNGEETPQEKKEESSFPVAAVLIPAVLAAAAVLYFLHRRKEEKLRQERRRKRLQRLRGEEPAGEPAAENGQNLEKTEDGREKEQDPEESPDR